MASYRSGEGVLGGPTSRDSTRWRRSARPSRPPQPPPPGAGTTPHPVGRPAVSNSGKLSPTSPLLTSRSQAQTGPRPLTGRHRARLWAPGTDLGGSPSRKGAPLDPSPRTLARCLGSFHKAELLPGPTGKVPLRPPEAPPRGARRAENTPSSQAPGGTAWGRDGRGPPSWQCRSHGGGGRAADTVRHGQRVAENQVPSSLRLPTGSRGGSGSRSDAAANQRSVRGRACWAHGVRGHRCWARPRVPGRTDVLRARCGAPGRCGPTGPAGASSPAERSAESGGEQAERAGDGLSGQ